MNGEKEPGGACIRFKTTARGGAPSFFSRPAKRRSAFTLMEVLVVIALLGTVTAFVAVDLMSLFEGAQQPSPFETLRSAMAAGREAARDSGVPVKVTFLPDTAVVRLTGAGGVKEFPLPAGATLGFYLPADASESGERPLDGVVFHPSGCSMPVTLDLGLSGTHSRYRMEMFSASLTEEARP